MLYQSCLPNLTCLLYYVRLKSCLDFNSSEYWSNLINLISLVSMSIILRKGFIILEDIISNDVKLKEWFLYFNWPMTITRCTLKMCASRSHLYFTYFHDFDSFFKNKSACDGDLHFFIHSSKFSSSFDTEHIIQCLKFTLCSIKNSSIGC